MVLGSVPAPPYPQRRRGTATATAFTLRWPSGLSSKQVERAGAPGGVVASEVPSFPWPPRAGGTVGLPVSGTCRLPDRPTGARGEGDSLPRDESGQPPLGGGNTAADGGPGGGAGPGRHRLEMRGLPGAAGGGAPPRERVEGPTGEPPLRGRARDRRGSGAAARPARRGSGGESQRLARDRRTPAPARFTIRRAASADFGASGVCPRAAGPTPLWLQGEQLVLGALPAPALLRQHRSPVLPAACAAGAPARCSGTAGRGREPRGRCVFVKTVSQSEGPSHGCLQGAVHTAGFTAL